MNEVIHTENMNFPTITQQSEIDVQITTAKQYPRVVADCYEQAKAMIEMSPDIASMCNYSLTKGKGNDAKIITGPSIRLAEIIMSNWGNLHCATRVTGEDQEYIYVQGAVHDLEKNVKYVSEMKRRITYAKGGKYGPDMVQTTASALSSIALRNAIFKVIPAVYIHELSRFATKQALGKESEFSKRIENCIVHFRDKYDISQDVLFDKIGVESISEMKPQHLTILLGISTALQENLTKVEDEFPTPIKEPQSTKAPKAPESKTKINPADDITLGLV